MLQTYGRRTADLLRYIADVLQAYFRPTAGIRQAYLISTCRHTAGLLHTYCRHTAGLPQTYLLTYCRPTPYLPYTSCRSDSRLLWVHCRPTLQIYFRRTPDILQTYWRSTKSAIGRHPRTVCIEVPKGLGEVHPAYEVCRRHLPAQTTAMVGRSTRKKQGARTVGNVNHAKGEENDQRKKKEKTLVR